MTLTANQRFGEWLFGQLTLVGDYRWQRGTALSTAERS